MGYSHSTLDFVQVSETVDIDIRVDVTPGAVEAGSPLSLDADGHATVIVEPAAALAGSPAIKPEGDASVSINPQAVSAGSGEISADVYVFVDVSPGAAEGATPAAIGRIEVVLPAAAEATDPGITVEAHETIVKIDPATGIAVSGDISGLVVTDPNPTVGISISLDPAAVIAGGGTGVEPESFEIDFTRTLTVFNFYITGSDGNKNIKVPITSFQLVLYADRNAYLEVNVPGLEWVDDITDRTDGNLSLKMGYAAISTLEVLQEEQVVKVPLENMDVHRGANKRAITLSGHETESQAESRQSTSKTVTLSDKWYNYKRMSDGKITARLVKPHMYLQAGDTIVDDDAEFVADRITWTKSERRHHMEIAGTAA